MTVGVRTILRAGEMKEENNAARNISNLLMGIYLRLEALEAKLAGFTVKLNLLSVFNITTTGGGGTYIAPNYFRETFTTGDDVSTSFPRTLLIFPPPASVRAVTPAQVNASDGTISVSGGWPTWTYAAPTVTISYLPGLEANKTYTVTWMVSA